jgi:GNAT superfamily N-acetyltransferase
MTWRIYREMLPAGYCLGAFTGEELVGFAIANARTWNRTLWIWGTARGIRLAGAGIGRRLVDVLAEKAGQLVCVPCWWKRRTPISCHRFYRRTGFEIEGIDLSYYYEL